MCLRSGWACVRSTGPPPSAAYLQGTNQHLTRWWPLHLIGGLPSRSCSRSHSCSPGPLALSSFNAFLPTPLFTPLTHPFQFPFPDQTAFPIAARWRRDSHTAQEGKKEDKGIKKSAPVPLRERERDHALIHVAVQYASTPSTGTRHEIVIRQSKQDIPIRTLR
ncbi:uncharacterized protein LY79DRAFT_69720 [Colletotrichum navitas]|uniref:Uncharacterized protein n=1 Tax=Colletotrichum navitas TaxID=681940 RepID=A0AAD8UYJ8_9PEZI|nr:uncharacterized protein LY79DRAFT_69720 [Colletotrichum navitas]KAK1569747.1 hypothetical protein LY79DRAFT_69720 [Colletotrichum navitas]